MEIIRDLPIAHKMEILLITENCTLDHSCTAVKRCPGQALIQEAFNAPTIEKERCIICGRCVNACSKGVFLKV